MNGFLPSHAGDTRQKELLVSQTSQEQPSTRGLSDLRAEVTLSEIHNKIAKNTTAH